AGERTMKVIDYKFYISEQAQAEFARKNTNIADAINEVTLNLESAINKIMARSDPPMEIKWNYLPQSELIMGANLGKCGASMIELSRILHEYFYNDSETSTIAMHDCDSSEYVDMFKASGLFSPYVTHNVSTVCTTRTLIFFEPENDKFTSMFGTALLKAAGIRHPNPLKLEEVTNGDTGKELILTVHDEAMKQLKETHCYRS
ncbi:hypothetical protein COBT_001584, partial [Conglomerata obtusa]